VCPSKKKCDAKLSEAGAFLETGDQRCGERMDTAGNAIVASVKPKGIMAWSSLSIPARSRLAVIDRIEQRREIPHSEGPLRNNCVISPKNTAYRDRAAQCRVSLAIMSRLEEDCKLNNGLVLGCFARLVDCWKWTFW